jgi:hypothetical protein
VLSPPVLIWYGRMTSIASGSAIVMEMMAMGVDKNQEQSRELGALGSLGRVGPS